MGAVSVFNRFTSTSPGKLKLLEKLVLGIDSDATPDDIKDAYRKLAKEFHPDHYGKNQSPFIAIQEAYSVLSDPVKRRDHDQSIQPPRPVQPSSIINYRSFKRPVEPLIPDPETIIDRHSLRYSDFSHSFRSPFDQLFDEVLNRFMR